MIRHRWFQLAAVVLLLASCAILYLRLQGWLGDVTYIAKGGESWMPPEVMDFIEDKHIAKVAIRAHRTGWKIWSAQGEVRAWYLNGQLNLRGYCSHDVPDGTWQQYDASGHLLLVQHFAMGRSEGTWMWWRSDGTLERTELWSEGSRKRATDFDRRGLPLSSTP